MGKTVGFGTKKDRPILKPAGKIPSLRDAVNETWKDAIGGKEPEIRDNPLLDLNVAEPPPAVPNIPREQPEKKRKDLNEDANEEVIKEPTDRGKVRKVQPNQFLDEVPPPPTQQPPFLNPTQEPVDDGGDQGEWPETTWDDDEDEEVPIEDEGEDMTEEPTSPTIPQSTLDKLAQYRDEGQFDNAVQSDPPNPDNNENQLGASTVVGEGTFEPQPPNTGADGMQRNNEGFDNTPGGLDPSVDASGDPGLSAPTDPVENTLGEPEYEGENPMVEEPSDAVVPFQQPQQPQQPPVDHAGLISAAMRAQEAQRASSDATTRERMAEINAANDRVVNVLKEAQATAEARHRQEIADWRIKLQEAESNARMRINELEQARSHAAAGSSSGENELRQKLADAERNYNAERDKNMALTLELAQAKAAPPPAPPVVQMEVDNTQNEALLEMKKEVENLREQLKTNEEKASAMEAESAKDHEITSLNTKIVQLEERCKQDQDRLTQERDASVQAFEELKKKDADLHAEYDLTLEKAKAAFIEAHNKEQREIAIAQLAADHERLQKEVAQLAGEKQAMLDRQAIATREYEAERIKELEQRVARGRQFEESVAESERKRAEKEQVLREKEIAELKHLAAQRQYADTAHGDFDLIPQQRPRNSNPLHNFERLSRLRGKNYDVESEKTDRRKLSKKETKQKLKNLVAKADGKKKKKKKKKTSKKEDPFAKFLG